MAALANNDLGEQNTTSINTPERIISSCPEIITSSGDSIPLNDITADGAEVSNDGIISIQPGNRNRDSQFACPIGIGFSANTALTDPTINNSVNNIANIKPGDLDPSALIQISVVSPVSPNPYRKLIAEQPKSIPGAITLAHTFSNGEANRLTQAGITIGCNTNNNYLDLNNGNVLFSPDSDIVIGTGEGKVSVGSGATVFIMESDKDLILYDLHQSKPKQVCVTVNREKLILEPGRMLVLTKEKTSDFKKLSMNCHCIRYRRAQALDLQDNSITAFAADFSICSALTKLQPLKQLLSSSDKREQLLVERILKGAIVLEACGHRS